MLSQCLELPYACVIGELCIACHAVLPKGPSFATVTPMHISKLINMIPVT